MVAERRPSINLDEAPEEELGGALADADRNSSFNSHVSLEEHRRSSKERRCTTSFAGPCPPLAVEGASLKEIISPSAAEQSAEFILKVLVPGHSAAVRARLRREQVFSAADLAGLDKDDLRELGLTMVERSKVLNWARQAFVPVDNSGRSRCGSLDAIPDEEEQRMMNSWSAQPQPLQRFMSDDGCGAGGFSHSLNFFLDDETETSRHLDDVESKADFWCNLVQHSGTTYLRDLEQVEDILCKGGEVGQVQGDLRENVLEKLFDLTPDRLKEVYEHIDRDSDGRIKKEELREGLHRCELHGLDGALEKVFSFVSREAGSLQLDEFASVLTRLKLAQLLSTPKFRFQAGAELLTILDYNSHRVEERKLPNLRDFFFGHRQQDFPMRWVHLRKFDLTLLLALTVKYQFHPLSVEDVVDQAPTKIDHFEGHYFVSIEHLEVMGSTNGMSQVEVRGRHVTVFCAGPPHLDTVITVSQSDRSFQQDWPGFQPGSVQSFQEDAWVGRLHKRLRAVRSRVRERRADFLMYEIIDLCTDDLRVVTRVFTTRLNWLEERLQKSKLNSEQRKLDWFNEVSIMRLQLAVVSRRLRGMQRILRRLSDDPDISMVLTGYLQDVADHVNEAYEDANHLGEKCSTLSDAYEHAEDRAQDKIYRENAQEQTVQDERMNKMLFILTILTTIFTPLTFVAGIYGMNFQDMDGHPTIPELLAPHGYYYFLAFTLVYLVFSCVVGVWLWRRVSRGIRKEALQPGTRSSVSIPGIDSWSFQPPANYSALP